VTEPRAILNRDDLIEVLRARKTELGLSNSFVDAQLQMADGGCDKVLGPSHKGMSLLVMFDLVELFGGKLVFEVDAETEARMRDRWERREERNVRESARVSKAILERARPAFYRQLSRLGNEARTKMLPPEARKRIARAAANCRWQRQRAAAVPMVHLPSALPRARMSAFEVDENAHRRTARSTKHP
jgi:hypothetical protein